MAAVSGAGLGSLRQGVGGALMGSSSAAGKKKKAKNYNDDGGTMSLKKAYKSGKVKAGKKKSKKKNKKNSSHGGAKAHARVMPQEGEPPSDDELPAGLDLGLDRDARRYLDLADSSFAECTIDMVKEEDPMVLLGPPFYDRYADINGHMAYDLVASSPEFELLSGNPGDPKVEHDGLSIAWVLDTAKLLLGVALPFLNVNLRSKQEENAHMEIYYQYFEHAKYRIPGMTIENNSEETVYVDRLEVSSFGHKEMLEPKEAENIAGIIYNPPSIAPGESAILSFRSDEGCYNALPTVEIRARLLAGDHVLIPTWELDANGEVKSE